MYNPNELRKIQLKKLEMLKDIVHCCEKNNLTYWLDSGTLLGAVRHKGFIPWDDDIDIAMPLEDAKTLNEIYSSEDYEIRSTEIESGVNFYKVISKKDFVCSGDEVLKVDIDIFVMQYYPNSLFLKFFNAFYHLRKNRSEEFQWKLCLENISINLRRKFEKIGYFSSKSLAEKIRKICERNPKKWDFVSYTYDCGFYLYFWKKNEIFPLGVMLFEDTYFKVPKDYHIYLKKLYYSYEKLPPVSRRRPPHYTNYEITLFHKKKEEE